MGALYENAEEEKKGPLLEWSLPHYKTCHWNCLPSDDCTIPPLLDLDSLYLTANKNISIRLLIEVFFIFLFDILASSHANLMRGPVPFLKGIVLGTKRINSVFCHPAIKSAPDRNQWNHSARPVCNIQSRIKGRICRYLFAKEGDVYSCSYVSVLQGYRLSELSHKHSYSRSILFSFPNKLNAII